MACGCPVITTGREPMSEAGGSGAIYINPADIHSSARITNDVLEWTYHRRVQQIKLGLENVNRFSPSEFFLDYQSIYKDVLNNFP